MKLSELKLNPDNPRSIKQEKLDKLAQSIKDFPKMMIKRPIVYDENKVIIGGNMRYRAIQSLGMKEIPDEWTSDASDFTPDERYRFIMQDNAEMGEHDWDMVANQYELEDLDAWGIDVPYADTEAEVEEDEAPEVSSEPPVSQLGVIYQLGRHRVMCGDSIKIDDTDKLMDGFRAEMAFTDPPYLMGFEGNVHADGSKSFNAKHGAIKNDKMSRDDGDDFIYAIFETLATYVEGAYYVCFYRLGLDYIFRALDKLGNAYKSLIIWSKGNHTLSNSDYMSKYEPIVYGWFSKHNFVGGKSNFDIWEIDRTSKNELHPTMKPIELCAKAIQNSSSKGDIVLDLFLGSGSTLIACEQTDRTCYGMELDPKYVDVIRKRYWKFTHHNNEEGWEDGTKAINI